MPNKTYGAAFIEGVYGIMKQEKELRIIGTGMVGGANARHQARLVKDFKNRIFEPPTSEGAIAALGTGAAMTGMPMLLHFGTSAFMLEAWNQIAHEAALSHYMSGGQVDVPLTFHGYHGVRAAGAPQHSASPQAMAANIPGLEIVLPSSPYDAKGLIRSALKSRNPTLFLNHTRLMNIEGEVPGRAYDIPFGKVDVKRRGRDVTIVASSWMVQVSLQAAAILAEDKISAEVVDLRTITPLDVAGICRSVKKTGRLVAVDEAPQTCSIASEVAAQVAQHAFRALRAPIERVCHLQAPTPFSPPLEKVIVPTPEKIAAAAKKTLGGKRPRRR